MKKIAVVFAFMAIGLFSYDAYSQSRYQGEASAGIAFGTGTFSESRIIGETVHGLRFNENFFAGLGLGTHYYLGNNNSDSGMVMPLFFDIRGYYPINTTLTPFASFDIGYGIGLWGIENSGIYFAPSIGLNVEMNWVDSMNFGLSFQSQNFSSNGISIALNAIVFKAGIVF